MSVLGQCMAIKNLTSPGWKEGERYSMVAHSFRDQLIVASIPDLCRSLFGTVSMGELTEEQLTELVKQIKRCFYSDVNQIARVTGRPYSEVARMLDHY